MYAASILIAVEPYQSDSRPRLLGKDPLAY